MAITEKFGVYSWGSGSFGELGNGKTENKNFPQKVILNQNLQII